MRRRLVDRSPSLYTRRCFGSATYAQLLHDGGGTEGGGLLEGEHGVIALVGKRLAGSRLACMAGGAYVKTGEVLSVAIEGVVVELDELTWCGCEYRGLFRMRMRG